jgi:hypothetical protein
LCLALKEAASKSCLEDRGVIACELLVNEERLLLGSNDEGYGLAQVAELSLESKVWKINIDLPEVWELRRGRGLWGRPSESSERPPFGRRHLVTLDANVSYFSNKNGFLNNLPEAVE